MLIKSPHDIPFGTLPKVFEKSPRLWVRDRCNLSCLSGSGQSDRKPERWQSKASPLDQTEFFETYKLFKYPLHSSPNPNNDALLLECHCKKYQYLQCNMIPVMVMHRESNIVMLQNAVAVLQIMECTPICLWWFWWDQCGCHVLRPHAWGLVSLLNQIWTFFA
jgi:hypothetical protein